MTRLRLCAIAVALAAGHCLAEPSTVERAIHRFGEMEALHDSPSGSPVPRQESSTSTTTPAPGSGTPNTTTKEAGDPSQWMESFIKAVQQQLQLQDHYLRQFVKDIQDFLSSLARSIQWDETQSAAFARVGEMMELINSRMTTARENVEELMATSENLDNETLRAATNKFMKEVRVQDVVVDALWASLRGMQTTAWMSGATVAEDRDAYAVANRAAEEFLSRMYHNLRTAGISEEDIVKFVPKTAEEGELMGRKMSMSARSYGWNYGSSYGYPLSRSYGYGWNYPTYSWSRYGYGYPSYPAYPAYPSYPIYPSYASYPRYYGWYGSRRLGPDCPNCPPAPSAMPPPQMAPPFRTPVDGPMGQGPVPPMMGQGFGARTLGFAPPMMETGMPPEFPAGFEPMEPMGSPMMPPMRPPMGARGEPNGFNNFEMPGSTGTGNRNLAPGNIPGFLDEPGMPNTPFGFGPNDEMPF